MLGRLFVATSPATSTWRCQTAFRRLNCRLLSSDKRPLAGPGIKVYRVEYPAYLHEISVSGSEHFGRLSLRTTDAMESLCWGMSSSGLEPFNRFAAHFGGRSVVEIRPGTCFGQNIVKCDYQGGPILQLELHSAIIF